MSAGSKPKPPATSAAPAAPGASASPGSKPAGSPAAAPSAATAPKPAAGAAVASSPPAAPALDLNSLEERLKDTHAIGLFTKLSLKNQVDDLLDEFRAFHHKQAQKTLAQLRQQYEVLLLKVLSLLQDGDPPLASAISSSREAIWRVLTDPEKFSRI